jgi:hypothetical protein
MSGVRFQTRVYPVENRKIPVPPANQAELSIPEITDLSTQQRKNNKVN